MTLYQLRHKRASSAAPSYPATRELFLFVRRILAERQGVAEPSHLQDVEVGALLDYDYKYTHQWRFGKKRMLDISELQELAATSQIPFNILRKVAIGLWDAEKAYQVLKRFNSAEMTTITKKITLKGASVDLQIRVEKNRVEAVKKALDQLKEKIQLRLENDNALIRERQEEIERFEKFVDDLDLPRVAFYRKP